MEKTKGVGWNRVWGNKGWIDFRKIEGFLFVDFVLIVYINIRISFLSLPDFYSFNQNSALHIISTSTSPEIHPPSQRLVRPEEILKPAQNPPPEPNLPLATGTIL